METKIVILVIAVIVVLILMWYYSHINEKKIINTKIDCANKDTFLDDWYKKERNNPNTINKNVGNIILDDIYDVTINNVKEKIIIGKKLNKLKCGKLYNLRDKIGLDIDILVVDKVNYDKYESYNDLASIRYLNSIIERDLHNIASEYVNKILTHRWKLLNKLSIIDRNINSHGSSYLYLKRDVPKIISKKTKKGFYRINLLCSEYDFDMLYKKLVNFSKKKN